MTENSSGVAAPTAALPQELLSRKDAAEFLCLNTRTLANWASAGIGPRYTSLGSRLGGGRAVYRRQDLIDWFDAQPTFAGKAA